MAAPAQELRRGDRARSGRRAERRPCLDTLRVPPYAIAAEQGVLGGLMLDGTAWPEISDTLKAEDFYRCEHQLIFRAVEALAERKEPFDVLTVAEELERLGEPEVARAAHLDVLARDTPSAAQIRAHAALVRTHAMSSWSGQDRPGDP